MLPYMTIVNGDLPNPTWIGQADILGKLLRYVTLQEEDTAY